jgi:hypothetical protein
MPRWASRLLLEIVDVRVQRVQEITEDDAIDEAADMPFSSAEEGGLATTRRRIREIAFPVLWDRVNAKRGFPWSANPWVWAIMFRRLQ